MADITDQHDQTSPTELDDAHVGNGNPNVGEARGIKRARPSAADDDDDDDDKGGRERRKIEIKFISDKSRRHITFSKRKAGIMKKVSFIHCALSIPFLAQTGENAACIASTRRDFVKYLFVLFANADPACQAYELSVLTGTQVLLLVVSETGLVYTFTTPKLQPLVTKAEGKNLIQVRNAPRCAISVPHVRNYTDEHPRPA